MYVIDEEGKSSILRVCREFMVGENKQFLKYEHGSGVKSSHSRYE